MNETLNYIAVTDERVLRKIFVIRNIKVMIDRDLAELYGVETKVLKQAVRRNMSRFPSDFMFEMSREEFYEWRNEYAAETGDKKGLRYAPFCFTEQGVAMLSSILNSERAIRVNIQIIRVFTKMRELLSNHKYLDARIDKIENELSGQDEKIIMIFEYLRKLDQEKQKTMKQKNRKPVGYRQNIRKSD